MPIYEYQCDQCGERFELLVRAAGQAKPVQCPVCGSEHVQRSISLFGVGGGSGRPASGADCGPGPV